MWLPPASTVDLSEIKEEEDEGEAIVAMAEIMKVTAIPSRQMERGLPSYPRLCLLL